MSAPNYKALAMSTSRMAFATARPSQEAADHAAMEECERLTGPLPQNASQMLRNQYRCELYASGTAVVSQRASTPMPPKPWISRASVERPFVAKEFPIFEPKFGDTAPYPSLPRSKALVPQPSGSWYRTSAEDGAEEAMRRGLERCGYLQQEPCLLIAVDDTFVAAVPTLARPVGIYSAAALSGSVRRDERAEMARRLTHATEGWNAVAVGAEGHVGIMTGAATEQSAVDGALKECAALTRPRLPRQGNRSVSDRD